MALPDRCELTSGDPTKLKETPDELVESGVPAGADSPVVGEHENKPGAVPAQVGPASKLFFWALKPKILVALTLVAIAYWAVAFFAHRFQEENQMHEYLDRAQMQDMHDQVVFEMHPRIGNNPYWKKALGLALVLGEDNNTLADLYTKSAKNESDHENRQRYLEKALAMYESTPNNVSAQLSTLDALIRETAPNLVDGYILTGPPEPALQHALDVARHKDFKSAILEYTILLDGAQSNNSSISTEGKLLNDGLSQIAVGLKNGDPLLVEALPLFHRCVYFHSDKLMALANQYRNLETVIRKSGKNPDDYKDRRELAFQALRQKDYLGACVELQWCLGHSDDQSLHNELRRTNMIVARMNGHNSLADAQQCLRWLQKKRRLLMQQTQFEGHILHTDIELAYAYISLGRVDEGVQLMRERLDGYAPESTVDSSGHVPLVGHALDPTVFDKLFAVLLKDGQFKQALALSTTVSKLGEYYSSGSSHAASKLYHSIICNFAAGHREEAETALQKLQKDPDGNYYRL